MQRTVKYIVDKKVVANEDTVLEEIENFRLERMQAAEQEIREVTRS